MNGLAELLLKLYNYCFEWSLVRSIWTKVLISPIPKGGMKNIYLPTSYRGLSLISTVAKVYSSLLNTRMIGHFDQNNTTVNEQAGFRKITRVWTKPSFYTM